MTHSEGHPGPLAVLTMGGPGSGKNFVLERDYLSRYALEEISCDRVKRWFGSNHRLSSDELHAHSTRIARELLDATLEARKPFCLDGTGANRDAYADIIRRAKARGYYVLLVYVDCPLAVARERNRHRDRMVPEVVLQERRTLAETNFPALALLADESRVVAND